MLGWGNSNPGPIALPSSALIKGPGFLCLPLESGSGRVGREEAGHLYSPVLSPQRPQRSAASVCVPATVPVAWPSPSCRLD